MAGAIIVIDQPGGAGLGSPGVARNDLWQNKQINLSCAAVNSQYQWDLLDVPPGSGAALIGSETSTPNFLPDLVGTYHIQLITNGGGPGNVQILVIRVRYSSTGVLQNNGWAFPAVGERAGEANYSGNSRGWAEVFEFILTDARLRLGALEERSPLPEAGDVGKVLQAGADGTATWEEGAGGAGAVVVLEERIHLRFSYKAPIEGSVFTGSIPSGAPLALTAFDFIESNWFGFERVVPQIIVGTNPDNVLNGVETGALPEPVTFTLTGTRFGSTLVRSVVVSAKGAYSFARVFDSLTSLVTDISVGAVCHFAIGKGTGVCNPIDPTAIEVSLDGYLKDNSPTIDGPTGTVIPSGAYNADESDLIIRYKAAV